MSTHSRYRMSIAFSNAGHTLTHLCTVLYATAVLHLPQVFGLSYGELLSLSSLGLILFGVAALPAGWLGDRWSVVGMMVVFFLGIGAGAVMTGLADDPETLFAGLTVIGLFASIYHPVGIAWIVASARKRGMTLGINAVFGNVGNSVAPVFVGAMIDFVSWRAAFILPGIVAILIGIALLAAWRRGWVSDAKTDRMPATEAPDRSTAYRVFIVLTFTMACTGFVYAGLTNTMPKVFEMGLGPELAVSYTEIGLFVGIHLRRRIVHQHPRRLARRPVLRPLHLLRVLGVADSAAVPHHLHDGPAAARGRVARAELQPRLLLGGEHADRALHPDTLARRRFRGEVRPRPRRGGNHRDPRRLDLRFAGELRRALRLVRHHRHRRHRRVPAAPGAPPPPRIRARRRRLARILHVHAERKAGGPPAPGWRAG